MKKYQVIVHSNLDQLLDEIRHRTDPEYTKWTSREFVCRASAERYAFLANIASGRDCSIKEIDPDRYRSLRDRVAHIMGRLGAE